MMVIVLAVAFTLVGFVQAPVSSAALWHHTYKGQVTSYDKAANTVVINGKKGDMTFDVSKATTNGMIRPNERVVVSYNKKNGEMVASSVKVVEPKAMKKETGSSETHGGY